MEKILIIYAHPDVKGHCKEILAQVKKSLKENNQQFTLIDLYKEKYDPVLKKEELYTAGNRKVSKKNKEIQKKIRQAEKFILIYPNWWNSMPAILKGFFDRVFVSHYAFKYEGKMPKGLLKGKAAVFMPSGSGKIISWLFLGNRAKKTIKKDILGFCGIKAKVFQIGNAYKLDTEQKQKIKRSVKKGMNYLFS